MGKKLLIALILIAGVMVVLIANSKGGAQVEVDLLFRQIEGLKSVVFLVFLGVGVAIGILLK